jgi:hypothetical protein
MQFTVSTAIKYARPGQIETWVHAYLTSGDWANPGLANGLRLQQRWWIGPISVDIADLTRVCGPEPSMEYRVALEQWELRITRLMQSIKDLMSVPPLIVEYRSGSLSIRDGNHRHEAMRRKGRLKCWVIIWHNSEEDFLLDPSATLADISDSRSNNC